MYIKRKAATAPAPVTVDPAFKAMSRGAHGLAGADFHGERIERKRMSDAYIARNPTPT